MKTFYLSYVRNQSLLVLQHLTENQNVVLEPCYITPTKRKNVDKWT
jgi:hypothetical protein